MTYRLTNHAEMAILAILAGSPQGLESGELIEKLEEFNIGRAQLLDAAQQLLNNQLITLRASCFLITPAGGHALIDLHAQIAAALDPSPNTPITEQCPTVPWLTTVQTCWLNAISINYSVSPDALAHLLPHPLEAEIFKGRAWVQLLISRLRDMRPQGTLPLFGVNFHQVSYRAAVKYKNKEGIWRRGGYFVRSETDNALMRLVGNSLIEFKFHEFGLSNIALVRQKNQLTATVSPETNSLGSLKATLDVARDYGPPQSSRWQSIKELQMPLIECYDAFGVQDDYVYILTIDRAPWGAQFAKPITLQSEYFSQGALGGNASELDSVLYIPNECAYRWRPLRRERWR